MEENQQFGEVSRHHSDRFCIGMEEHVKLPMSAGRIVPWYYESHVTVEPCEGDRLDSLREICAVEGFRVADLLLRNGELARNDSFCSGKSKDYGELLGRMKGLLGRLEEPGYGILRYKIEVVVLDSRCVDELTYLGRGDRDIAVGMGDLPVWLGDYGFREWQDRFGNKERVRMSEIVLAAYHGEGISAHVVSQLLDWFERIGKLEGLRGWAYNKWREGKIREVPDHKLDAKVRREMEEVFHLMARESSEYYLIEIVEWLKMARSQNETDAPWKEAEQPQLSWLPPIADPVVQSNKTEDPSASLGMAAKLGETVIAGQTREGTDPVSELYQISDPVMQMCKFAEDLIEKRRSEKESRVMPKAARTPKPVFKGCYCAGWCMCDEVASERLQEWEAEQKRLDEEESAASLTEAKRLAELRYIRTTAGKKVIEGWDKLSTECGFLIHMLGDKPMTISEISDAIDKYNFDYPEDPFEYEEGTLQGYIDELVKIGAASLAEEKKEFVLEFEMAQAPTKKGDMLHLKGTALHLTFAPKQALEPVTVAKQSTSEPVSLNLSYLRSK